MIIASCIRDKSLVGMVYLLRKSHHNSTIKPSIQNPPISFLDNIVLSLHCRFQCLIFSRCRERTLESFLQKHIQLPYALGLRPLRHNYKHLLEMYISTHHCSGTIVKLILHLHRPKKGANTAWHGTHVLLQCKQWPMRAMPAHFSQPGWHGTARYFY